MEIPNMKKLFWFILLTMFMIGLVCNGLVIFGGIGTFWTGFLLGIDIFGILFLTWMKLSGRVV